MFNMDPGKWLPALPLFGSLVCVYCGGPADTSDHTPPLCLLPKPWPGNVQVMTVPACSKCNGEFSQDEMRTAAAQAVCLCANAALAPLYPGCRPSAQSNPRTSPRLDRRTPAFSTKTGLARSCWPWSFPNVEPASEFHGHQTEQPRSALWSTETLGPSPSGGLFRSLLPVVKPDKAARQTLPSLGKPHPSGPARQDTG